jgi:hypothetical protein
LNQWGVPDSDQPSLDRQTDTLQNAPTEIIPKAETAEGLAGTRELPAVQPPAATPPEAPPTEIVEPPAAGLPELPVIQRGPVADPIVAALATGAPTRDPELAAPPTVVVEPPVAARVEAPVETPAAALVETPAEAPAEAPVAAPLDLLPTKAAKTPKPGRRPKPRAKPPKPPKPPRPPRQPREPKVGPALSTLRDRAGRGAGGRWAALLALLAVVIFVALSRASGGTGTTTPAGSRAPSIVGNLAAAAPAKAAPSKAPAAKPAGTVTIPAQVSSVDPSGGSGFRSDDGRWRTQRYGTADFGNLKPGVGLLLDLGAPRAVTSVSFDADGAVTAELRAGDDPASDGDAFTQVTEPKQADGGTTLDGAKGGEHRYWLVWVTELPSSGGGYEAVLSTPVVKGPAG